MPETHKKDELFKAASDFDEPEIITAPEETDGTVEKTDVVSEPVMVSESDGEKADSEIFEESKDASDSADDAVAKDETETAQDGKENSIEEFVHSDELKKKQKGLKSKKSKKKKADIEADDEVSDEESAQSSPECEEPDSKDKEKPSKPQNTASHVFLFGGRLKMPRIVLALLRMIIPLAAIAVCAVFVSGMISDTMKEANNIEGKFEIVDVNSQDYINLESDGTFDMADGSEGTWTLSGNVFEFKKSSGKIVEGRLIDKKYIVLIDENFISGHVPDGDEIEASFNEQNGGVILLDSMGNARLTSNIGEETVGSYMIDSNFIIITVGNTNTTYLKCGDGITAVYYQI
ncbi:MAG: hypothetical protein IJB70_12155 [Clostridia bacterium]|nr:hypothetical protein [Clostridia bacterium]